MHQTEPTNCTVGCQTLPKPEPPVKIITKTQIVCQNCYEMESQVEAITQEKIAFLVQFDEKLTEIKELSEENENLQIDVDILKRELAEWQNGTTYSMNSSVFQGKPDFQKNDSRKTKMEKRMKQLKKMGEKKRGRAMIQKIDNTYLDLPQKKTAYKAPLRILLESQREENKVLEIAEVDNSRIKIDTTYDFQELQDGNWQKTAARTCRNQDSLPLLQGIDIDGVSDEEELGRQNLKAKDEGLGTITAKNG